MMMMEMMINDGSENFDAYFLAVWKSEPWVVDFPGSFISARVSTVEISNRFFWHLQIFFPVAREKYFF